MNKKKLGLILIKIGIVLFLVNLFANYEYIDTSTKILVSIIILLAFYGGMLTKEVKNKKRK